MNRYYNPVHTIQGAGCVDCLPELLDEMDLPDKSVLLLAWGENVFQRPVFSKLIEDHRNFKICPRVFKESNPTVEQLFDIYQETKQFRPSAVVAVGGGSIMDVGKSLCCLYGSEIADVDGLREMIREKNYTAPKARWIGIPTTAGTGSEATCWATIWDPSQDAKRSVENQENYAYAALVDPELAEGMPLRLAVSSALDAVAHAVESYWAKGTNCVSKALALNAVQVIMRHLEELLSGQEGAHDAMAQGSMLAGLAFSNTKTTACHSISYPLTMHYNIPHGTAVSMLLGPVFRMNAEAIEDRGALLQALGVSGAEELKERIDSILRRSGQPCSLHAWGVGREDLPHLAELGITKGRADNNPVEVTAENILSVLEEIF